MRPHAVGVSVNGLKNAVAFCADKCGIDRGVPAVRRP